jgi:hypothetical protein
MLFPNKDHSKESLYLSKKMAYLSGESGCLKDGLSIFEEALSL